MTADVSDAAGNPATEATQTLTVDETRADHCDRQQSAGGDNTVNISEVAAGFAITGTTTGAESGQTVTVISSTAQRRCRQLHHHGRQRHLVGQRHGGTGAGAGRRQLHGDGRRLRSAGNPATEATQTLTVDEPAPTIAIDSNLAGDDNTVNMSEAAAGFAITGTTTGAESGQTVTVHIVDGSNAVVIPTPPRRATAPGRST